MSGWKQALPESVIGTMAPTIAAALGGPLAGLATAAIAGAFGLGDVVSERQLAAAVGKASPDQLFTLKQPRGTRASRAGLHRSPARAGCGYRTGERRRLHIGSAA